MHASQPSQQVQVKQKHPVKSLLRFTEQLGLLIIIFATIIAIGMEIHIMVRNLEVKLADLLLLFIYLEVLAMVGIYYDSHRMPVRFPLYIAIVALARYVILDSKTMTPAALLATGATMLLMALTILVIRYGHIKWPYGDCE